jgi:hypothetical protein
MIAFHDIKAEMRKACAAISQPQMQAAESVARVSRGGEEADDLIQPWMQEAFEALVTAYVTREPFMLLPCTVNGEPTAAIVHVSHTDERHRTHVTPLFVAMTPGMVLIDQKGRRAGSSDAPIDDGDAPAPS